MITLVFLSFHSAHHIRRILKTIDKFKKDLFNFRFQKISSQVTNPAKISETKKSIARLKTVLRGKNA